ncbi:MAG: class I SAM-dependent methyltransferase [Candidatus Competibacteraceae bacterium]|nr:MAG: class I SAM-dependent methyltransferase [Candidatus Competibacteraceae bacterium]
MTTLVEKLDRALYPDYARNWDDQLFRERILQRLTPTAVILDLGAGAGIVQQMDFRGHAARICGVDLDPRVVDNPMLDEGQVADANGIPWPDASFDVVFADNVLEHLPDPLAVFREVARVLNRANPISVKSLCRRR